MYHPPRNHSELTPKPVIGRPLIIFDFDNTGRYVSGVSRYLEALGTAFGKVAIGDHSSVRFVRGRRGRNAVVGHSDRLVQLGSAVLRIR